MTEEDQDSSEKASDAPAEPTAPAEPAASEPASTEPAATEPAATTKKGKKRRKNKAAAPARSEVDAEGRERPQFLLGFPHDPELESLIAAFEAGNYAHVRETAPRLIEHSEQANVKAAARELLERIEPDPLVKFLLAVAVALFVAVVLIVYHSHG